MGAIRQNKDANNKTVEESKNEEQSYFYNFDDELMLAYRSTSNTKHKELCMPIVLPPAFKYDDPLVAHWDDGDVRSIPGITWGKYGNMQDPSARTASSVLWKAVQKGTNHKLTIVQRVDRNLLIILKEQQKQVLGMRLDHFGSIPDQSKPLPPNSEILNKATSVMKEIGMQFATGELQRADLIPYRNKMLVLDSKKTQSTENLEPEQRKTKQRKKKDSHEFILRKLHAQ